MRFIWEGPVVGAALQDLLRDLCSLDGLSGFEGAVAAYVRAFLAERVDRIETDPLGNVIAALRLPGSGSGGSLKVMFCAHMDEVGLIVKAVEPDGFLRFEKVGVIPDAFLPRTPVRINGIPGTVGTRPGYLPGGPSPGEAGARDLYVDVGAASDEEVAELGIRIGDPICFATEYTQLATSSRALGKAVDDRAGCAVLLFLAERLQALRRVSHERALEVILAFTAQEEVGCRGAAVAAFRSRPDWAFVVDTVPSADTPDASLTKDINAGLGKGVVFPLVSGGVGMGEIMAGPVKERMLAVARTLGVGCQLAILPVAPTDSSVIRISGGGVPVGTIGIPRRYAHSPVELVDLRDVEAAAVLVEGLVKDFLSGGEPI